MVGPAGGSGKGRRGASTLPNSRHQRTRARTLHQSDHSGEPPTAKGLAVFRDPNVVKRTATSINWHPEGPAKIAVSYSILSFQDPRAANAHMPKKSYIWDILNPNTPEQELLPQR